MYLYIFVFQSGEKKTKPPIANNINNIGSVIGNRQRCILVFNDFRIFFVYAYALTRHITTLFCSIRFICSLFINRMCVHCSSKFQRFFYSFLVLFFNFVCEMRNYFRSLFFLCRTRYLSFFRFVFVDFIFGCFFFVLIVE